MRSWEISLHVHGGGCDLLLTNFMNNACLTSQNPPPQLTHTQQWSCWYREWVQGWHPGSMSSQRPLLTLRSPPSAPSCLTFPGQEWGSTSTSPVFSLPTLFFEVKLKRTLLPPQAGEAAWLTFQNWSPSGSRRKSKQRPHLDPGEIWKATKMSIGARADRILDEA